MKLLFLLGTRPEVIKMATPAQVYGDGKAAVRILHALLHYRNGEYADKDVLV